MKTLLISFFGLFLAMPALAQTLPPVTPGKDAPLKFANSANPIACDKIVDAMHEFSLLSRQHEASLTTFLGEVSQKLSTWYGQLAPLEGQTQTLPMGIFKPLKDGGDRVSEITDMAYDNSDAVAAQLDNIANSLSRCTIK